MDRSNEFKFYIVQEQVFLLEKLLIENHIEFHNEEELTEARSLKYYIKNEDRIKLDKLVKEHHIVLQTDSIPFVEYRSPEKINFSLVLASVVIIFLIIFLVWLT